MSTLQHKFDSPVFKEQWEQVKGKINTKQRGKRKTLVQRLKKHYRNAPTEKRHPRKLGYPLGFASSNKVSKTTAIFRCRQNFERRICNFSVSHL